MAENSPGEDGPADDGKVEVRVRLDPAVIEELRELAARPDQPPEAGSTLAEKVLDAVLLTGVASGVFGMQFGPVAAGAGLSLIWPAFQEAVLGKTHDYKQKRDLVKRINGLLKAHGVGIKRPGGTEACIVLAVTSHDKKGRFILEGRHTRKRTNSAEKIDDLLKDAEFVPADSK